MPGVAKPLKASNSLRQTRPWIGFRYFYAITPRYLFGLNPGDGRSKVEARNWLTRRVKERWKIAILKQSSKQILAQMNLDEKLAQLGSYWVTELLTDLSFDEQKAAQKLSFGIGQITRLAGATNFKARESAQTANRIQKHLIKNTRLGIPALIHEECCSGYTARGNNFSASYWRGLHLGA